MAHDQHFHFHGGSRPDLHTSPYVLRYDRFSISLRRNITEFVILVRRSENWSESRNVTQALVSAIELEGANPTIESIARLAKALGVTVADLFAEAPSRA